MADHSNDQGADAQSGNDAADPRQNEPRQGIPGKGFDAGTGYGGGGNDSMYSAESSYGGQSGIGGSRMRGAYAGEDYGRTGPGEEQSGGAGGQTNAARDTDGRGSANEGEGPADPNVEAVTEAFEGRGASNDASNDDMPASGISRDGPDAIDLDDFSGGSRREPGR